MVGRLMVLPRVSVNSASHRMAQPSEQPSSIMSKRLSRNKAIAELTALFERNGYIRRPIRARLSEDGSQRYKKGSEVRLVASTRTELAYIGELLDILDFTPGRPFTKAQQFCLPIYGNKQVARFAALVDKN